MCYARLPAGVARDMEMLETALIAEFQDNERCCRNRQLGAERRKDFMPGSRLRTMHVEQQHVLPSAAHPRMIGFKFSLDH